jgi:hypothetical protein
MWARDDRLEAGYSCVDCKSVNAFHVAENTNISQAFILLVHTSLPRPRGSPPPHIPRSAMDMRTNQPVVCEAFAFEGGIEWREEDMSLYLAGIQFLQEIGEGITSLRRPSFSVPSNGAYTPHSCTLHHRRPPRTKPGKYFGILPGLLVGPDACRQKGVAFRYGPYQSVPGRSISSARRALACDIGKVGVRIDPSVALTPLVAQPPPVR